MSPDVPDRSRPPASPSPLLTVVIVNYDGWPDVLRLVASLAEEPEVGSGRCEVVVVDNATPGPIPVEMTVPRPGVRLVSRRDNGGFAAGVNAGWRASKSPWLLVLNPDVVVPPGLLGRVTSRIEHDRERSRRGARGRRIRPAQSRRDPTALRRHLPEPGPDRLGAVDTAFASEIPGRLADTPGAGRLGHGRLRAGQRGHPSRPRGDGRGFLPLLRGGRPLPGRQALGWRVEYDPSVEVVHLHPLQNRPILPMMRVITRHSKLLYFRKHLPHWQFVGLSWIVSAEVLMRSAWSRGPGMGRGRPCLADDRRGDETAAGGDGVARTRRTGAGGGRDGDGRAPREPGLPQRGRIGKETR